MVVAERSSPSQSTRTGAMGSPLPSLAPMDSATPINGSALRFLWMRSVRPYYYYVTENFPNHGPPLRAGTFFHACTPELAANMVPSCGK